MTEAGLEALEGFILSLRQARESAGLSLDEVASRSGIDKGPSLADWKTARFTNSKAFQHALALRPCDRQTAGMVFGRHPIAAPR